MHKYIEYCEKWSHADDIVCCSDCNYLHEYTQIDRQCRERNELLEHECTLLHRRVELDCFCSWGDRR